MNFMSNPQNASKNKKQTEKSMPSRMVQSFKVNTLNQFGQMPLMNQTLAGKAMSFSMPK